MNNQLTKMTQHSITREDTVKISPDGIEFDAGFWSVGGLLAVALIIYMWRRK